MKRLRMGTRGSELALYQTRRVSRWIEERLGYDTELTILTTHGDRDRERPLDQLGAVGVFTKELEKALLDDRVDLAVHSLKDLPTLLPAGLVLAAVPERVNPSDMLLVRADAVSPAAFESSDGFVLPLAPGARVGSSSRRRRVQLLAARPDLEINDIRGNVATRVQKLRRGDYDAIVLAVAGLSRLELDLHELTTVVLPLDFMVPAPGQGALAVEAREADQDLLEGLRASLHDEDAAACVGCERRLLRLIEGGCSVPLGAYAIRRPTGQFELSAVLGPEDPTASRPRLRRALVRASTADAAAELAFRILRPEGAAAARAPGTGPSSSSGAAELDPASHDQPSSNSTELGQAAALVNAPTPGRERLRGRSVLILRDPNDAGDLVEALETGGAAVRCESPIELLALASPEEIRTAVEALPAGSSCALFASRSAVRFLAEGLRATELVPGAVLSNARVGALGPGTAAELARVGIALDWLAADSTGGGLAREFLESKLPRDTVVLLPAARDGRPELREALQSASFDVRFLVLYENRVRPVPVVSEQPWDAIVVASPSGVAALPDRISSRIIAIGPTTATALRARGLTVAAVASQPTTVGVLESLVQALAGETARASTT